MATLPEEEQAEVVARGEKEILVKAKEIRAAKHAAKKQERIEILETTATSGFQHLLCRATNLHDGGVAHQEADVGGVLGIEVQRTIGYDPARHAFGGVPSSCLLTL